MSERISPHIHCARAPRASREVKTHNGKLHYTYYATAAALTCKLGVCVGARNWAEPLRIGSAAAAYLNPLRNELLHGHAAESTESTREDLAKLDAVQLFCAQIMNIL